ncbi:hypothetical protein R3O64_04060 [Corynebacterium hesseae]|uniref:hypothetical protein n=1 Tax=Corynebacterium hesseae TaxID=2913502 RepID=UPI0030CAE89D
MTRNRFEIADWLLSWLDKNPTSPTSFHHLSIESGFSNEYLYHSAKMLEGLQLLTFETDWNQELFYGRLTGTGQHLVFSGKSVEDYGIDPGHHTTNTAVNVHGDVNGGQVGINNEHSVTINVSTAQIQNLIDALRESGHDDAAEVIDQETDGGARTSRLPTALRKGLSVLGDAGSAATILGSVATALIGLF